MALVLRSVNIVVRCPEGRTLLQMRDGNAVAQPLLWSFWGGAINERDDGSGAAAARELAEEAGIAAHASDFELLAERRSSTQIAHLVLLRKPVGWRDLDIREGAGAGFFWARDMAQLPVTRAVRYHLEHHSMHFA